MHPTIIIHNKMRKVLVGGIIIIRIMPITITPTTMHQILIILIIIAPFHGVRIIIIMPTTTIIRAANEDSCKSSSDAY